MGEGLSTTYPPKPKSKIEIRIEVADRDCGVRGSSPPLCGGAPLFRRRKRPARPDAGGARPGPDSAGGGPAGAPAAVLRTVSGPILEEMQDRGRSRFPFPVPSDAGGPFFRPFPPFPCPFPLLLPVSSASVGRVRALILPLIVRTCCRSLAAEGLPDLFPVKSCGGCLAGPVGGADLGGSWAACPALHASALLGRSAARAAAGLLLPLMQAGPVSADPGRR